MLSMVYLLLRSLGPPIRLCRYATANESLSNAQMLVPDLAGARSVISKNNFLSSFKHRFALLAIPYFTTQGKDCIHSKLPKSQLFYDFLTFLLTLIPLP